MKVFAIDPGPTKSGWCLLEDGAPTDWGWSKNLNLGASVRKFVEYDKNPWSHVVIEDVGNYGMAVGRTPLKQLSGLEDSTRSMLPQ